MNEKPAFYKYVGVQGILAIALVAGYIAAPFAGVTLPEGYAEFTTFVTGFFVAKNGPGLISSLRKQ